MSLTSQIEAYFTSIQITDLELVGDIDRSSVTINISYRLVNLNQNDTVVINIQNA
jgi:hypothetical protein